MVKVFQVSTADANGQGWKLPFQPQSAPLQVVHPDDSADSGATCPFGLSTSAGGLAWQSGADEGQHGAFWIPGPAINQRIQQLYFPFHTGRLKVF